MIDELARYIYCTLLHICIIFLDTFVLYRADLHATCWTGERQYGDCNVFIMFYHYKILRGLGEGGHPPAVTKSVQSTVVDIPTS